MVHIRTIFLSGLHIGPLYGDARLLLLLLLLLLLWACAINPLVASPPASLSPPTASSLGSWTWPCERLGVWASAVCLPTSPSARPCRCGRGPEFGWFLRPRAAPVLTHDPKARIQRQPKRHAAENAVWQVAGLLATTITTTAYYHWLQQRSKQKVSFRSACRLPLALPPRNGGGAE